MKAIGAIIVAIVILFAVDQEFTAGRYTDTVKQAIGEIRHSLGF